MDQMLSLSLFQQFLDELPTGVILLDSAGRVIHFNRTEERLAGRSRADVLGKRFFEEVAPCMDVRELGKRFRANIGRIPLHAEVEMSFPFATQKQPREARVKLGSFDLDGAVYGCVFVEDISNARAVERMKQTLSELLVHDLKNPLAAMLVNIDFVADELKVKGPIQDSLRDARQAGGTLQRMLINLLDVARLETGGFPLRRIRGDLRVLVRASVASMDALARAAGVALVADLPAEEVVTEFDADILQRALGNLIDNALRFTPAGKRVAVTCGMQGAGCALEVRDGGRGIPEAFLARVFERYATSGTRADNRGLGLTFVRLAAEAHGGAASVECPPGGGTVFRVALPLVDSAGSLPAPEVIVGRA